MNKLFNTPLHPILLCKRWDTGMYYQLTTSELQRNASRLNGRRHHILFFPLCVLFCLSCAMPGREKLGTRVAADEITFPSSLATFCILRHPFHNGSNASTPTTSSPSRIRTSCFPSLYLYNFFSSKPIFFLVWKLPTQPLASLPTPRRRHPPRRRRRRHDHDHPTHAHSPTSPRASDLHVEFHHKHGCEEHV